MYYVDSMNILFDVIEFLIFYYVKVYLNWW